MRLLLVEPPKKTWELMGQCISPPLGLAQLAAVLEAECIVLLLRGHYPNLGPFSIVPGIYYSRRVSPSLPLS